MFRILLRTLSNPWLHLSKYVGSDGQTSDEVCSRLGSYSCALITSTSHWSAHGVNRNRFGLDLKLIRSPFCRKLWKYNRVNRIESKVESSRVESTRNSIQIEIRIESKLESSRVELTRNSIRIEIRIESKLESSRVGSTRNSIRVEIRIDSKLESSRVE